MDILLAYYSRTGHTARLAEILATRLRARGHAVTMEAIAVVRQRSRWRLALPLLSTLPVLPLYLWLPAFRRWWHARYPQAEQAIHPPTVTNAARFDCICIGGPKWLYIAYPVARYLRQLEGMSGKPVAAFATFCGPPLPVFEIEMLFAPLSDRIRTKGAQPGPQLAVSSHYHEFFFFNEMEYVFRLVSRVFFGRSLRSFGIDSGWGEEQIERFVADICALDRCGHGRRTEMEIAAAQRPGP